jgi:hypothetical protein|tara:strand:- start:380 stop:607 length:228 start_codon:yes stop_codon:yes gene_type:complete
VEFLDFFIIVIMSGGLFAFATWGLRDDVVHPEMKGVKDDEELLSVDFKSCSIEEYNVLQDRIAKIKNELESDSPG